METKQQIRAVYKKKRDKMSVSHAEQLSARIAERVLQMETYQKARAVYFYYPLGKEVSLLPVIRDALNRNIPCAFPKVQGMAMEFYQISDLDELKEGAFHVMEPQREGSGPVHWEHALCFIPGVVFDKEGGRFGYGKGYYDRYFFGKHTCVLMGCAYEDQIVDKLPLQPWDRRMDFLVSENGIRSF